MIFRLFMYQPVYENTESTRSLCELSFSWGREGEKNTARARARILAFSRFQLTERQCCVDPDPSLRPYRGFRRAESSPGMSPRRGTSIIPPFSRHFFFSSSFLLLYTC